MRGGLFRPGYPISINDLKDVVEAANSGQSRTLGGSIDTQSGESGAAYQPTTKFDANLKILKVTGTVTGGYSFQKVYDPDADGIYSTMPHGLVSVSGMYLVAKSGVTFATNDIVVARLNPFNPYRWETLCLLAAAGAGATTNSLTFNTGTNDLTSTVNGVGSIVNLPFGNTFSRTVASNTNLTASADNTWNAISGFTVASVLGFGTVILRLRLAVNVSGTPNAISARLTLGGTAITNSEARALYIGSGTDIESYLNLVMPINSGSSATLGVEYYKDNTGGAFNVVSMLSDAFGRSSLEFDKGF